jgi:hypothetical protein
MAWLLGLRGRSWHAACAIVRIVARLRRRAPLPGRAGALRGGYLALA